METEGTEVIRILLVDDVEKIRESMVSKQQRGFEGRILMWW